MTNQLYHSQEKEFTCEYQFDGETWGVSIYASSWEEAEKKLKAVSSGKVLGPVGANIYIPSNSPSWLVKLGQLLADQLIRFLSWTRTS